MNWHQLSVFSDILSSTPFHAQTSRCVSHDAPTRCIGFSEPDLTLPISMLMRDHANAPWGPSCARPIGRSLPQAGLLTAPEGTHSRIERRERGRPPVETGIGRSQIRNIGFVAVSNWSCSAMRELVRCIRMCAPEKKNIYIYIGSLFDYILRIYLFLRIKWATCWLTPRVFASSI